MLCTARALGEFGAVSVVSGHIRGYTNTLPLQIEILYNEYNIVAAFSVAVLLLALLLVLLFLPNGRSPNWLAANLQIFPNIRPLVAADGFRLRGVIWRLP